MESSICGAKQPSYISLTFRDSHFIHQHHLKSFTNFWDVEGGAKIAQGKLSPKWRPGYGVVCLCVFGLLNLTLEDSRPQAQSGRGPVGRFQAKARRLSHTC